MANTNAFKMGLEGRKKGLTTKPSFDAELFNATQYSQSTQMQSLIYHPIKSHTTENVQKIIQ